MESFMTQVLTQDSICCIGYICSFPGVQYIFLWLLFSSFFLSIPCKNRGKPHSCALSSKKVFHTLIRSGKKKKKPHISSYPHGNAPLAGAELEVRETKTSGSGGALLTWVAWTAINSEPFNCRGISFLPLRPFSTGWEKTHYMLTLPPGKLG